MPSPDEAATQQHTEDFSNRALSPLEEDCSLLHAETKDVDQNLMHTAEQGTSMQESDVKAQLCGKQSRLNWVTIAMTKAFGFFWDSYSLLILVASVMMAVNLFCVKILARNTSIFEAVLIRAFFDIWILVAICRWNGFPMFEPRDKLRFLFLRGVCGASAFLCLSLAAFLLPLSDVAFLTNSNPVVTAVLSWLLGMEQLSLLSWTGVLGCVAGNAFVAHPPFLFGGHEDWGARRVLGITIALLCNLFLGSTFIVIRHIGEAVPSTVLSLYMHACCFVLCLPFLCAGFPMAVNIRYSFVDVVCYAAIIFFGVFAQLVLTRSFQIGPPTKVTSIYMTNMLVGALIGVLFLSEKLTWMSGFGSIVIVFSVLLVISQRSNMSYKYKPVSTVDDKDEVQLTVCDDLSARTTLS